jgi:hypothetical protein
MLKRRLIGLAVAASIVGASPAATPASETPPNRETG